MAVVKKLVVTWGKNILVLVQSPESLHKGWSVYDGNAIKDVNLVWGTNWINAVNENI